jgi:vitamin B12 transporter
MSSSFLKSRWPKVALLAMPCAVADICEAELAPVPATIDRIFVTAARMPQSLASLVADVTVIGAEDIARAGAQSVAELLARVPGVEIATNGGPGSTTSVFLRGANRGHTLVLIDGMRVGSSTDGATALEAIPLDHVDHIEILRGPASSLYGADAIGGVIQIFTRKGDGALSANASAGYGTYDTRAFSAGASGGGPLWRFALQAATRRSAGFDAIANPANFSANPDRDGYEDDSASGSLAVRWADEQELSARFLRSRLDAQFDAGMGFDDRTITTLSTFAVASRNRLSAWWMSRVEAGEGIDDSLSKTGFGPSRFKTRQRQYTWQNDFSIPVGVLSIAVERREERVQSDVDFPVTARNTNAVVGVWQWHDESQTLQANLRHDESSQFGGRTTGAIAYGYAFGHGLRASAGYGTAFKAPTFNDLYFPFFSNPDLRPETARNAEAALRYASADVAAGIVAYRNRVRDLIVFQCDASFNCAPQNVANATLEGVTLELEVRAGDTLLRASGDWQRPEDDASGKLLPRRARRHAAIAATQLLGPLTLGAELVASSARFDDSANSRRMGGYAIVNLIADCELGRGWALLARLNNAFDKRYELAADYNTPRANAFAGVRYRY